MIGMDSNVLVRYLAQDDAKQSAVASRLIDGELSASNPGFISLMVLVEVCWVLKRLYAATQSELAETLTDFLGVTQFRVERREVVQAATRRFSSQKDTKVEITDLLIAEVAQDQGCTHTVSFDKGAVRSAGMVLLK
jgi:predicted nucleic-acid-binding protein